MDYVEFTGAVEWHASFGGADGVIGIDNTGGDVTLTGTAVFRIDNWDRADIWVKHIWEEIDFIEKGAADISQAPPEGGIAVPPGYAVVQDWWGDSWWLNQPIFLARQNAFWTVAPNPQWEEKVIHFTVPPGDYAFVDRLHIATECVENRPPGHIPFLTQWGMIALVVLLLIAGATVIRRQRAMSGA